MQIREATDADVDAITGLKLRLIRSWFDDPTTVDDHPDLPDRVRERLVDLLPRDHHLFVVAEDDRDGVVACMSAVVTKHLPGPGWSGVHGHLGDLFVVPERRGEGLARLLMERCLAFCREHECVMVEMHATRMAVPMYLAMGWVAPNPEEIGEQFTTLKLSLRT